MGPHTRSWSSLPADVSSIVLGGFALCGLKENLLSCTDGSEVKFESSPTAVDM